MQSAVVVECRPEVNPSAVVRSKARVATRDSTPRVCVWGGSAESPFEIKLIALSFVELPGAERNPSQSWSG